jgi:dipeptidyl aminopeptidase/acylaminoacyl peptidase
MKAGGGGRARDTSGVSGAESSEGRHRFGGSFRGGKEMRIERRALLGALGASAALGTAPLRAAAAAAAEGGQRPPKIPVEILAEKAAMRGLILSPDGRMVLARMQVRGEEMLGTYVLSTGALKGYSLPKDNDLAWYRWAGNNRFIVSLAMKANQIDSEVGSLDTYSIEGRATRLACFELGAEAATFIGLSDASLQGDDVLFVDPEGEYLLLSLKKSYFLPPSVYRFDLKNNHSSLVVRALDGVYDWYADDKGVVRAGIGRGRDGWFFAYRPGPEVEFRKVASGEDRIFEQAMPGEMHFVGGTDLGYTLSVGQNGLSAVYKFDFAKRTLGDLVFACPTNDVESLDFGNDDHDLIAVGYTDDRERVAWLDPLMKEVQDGIDRAMPGRENRILSRSRDKNVLLVHSSTSRDPGIYYVFQLATSKLNPLVRPSDKLVPAQLATMEAVRYRARDGLEIPAYLTLPVGREAKNLPLVILPHGGPYGVRDTLGFDAEVQFLANRGYAVLQPNYRGSDSYGIAFHKSGEGEWGRKMQDDLDDGMDWLVGRGIVDRKRVALVGSSYGGYAAAWGATRNPERYRCASCFAGVFNLRSQLSYAGDFLTSRLYKQWRTMVRGADSFDLDSVSPLLRAKDLQVPVMLIHGDADTTVPVGQSKSYDAALTRAGKTHEYYIIKDEGHGFFKQKESFAFYLGKLDAFLARYNPGDLA